MVGTSNQRNRHRLKICLLGLVIFMLLLAYPLGVGPWICYSNSLPAPVKQFGDKYYYAPISEALASDAFHETWIGELYVDYLFWWIDSGLGEEF